MTTTYNNLVQAEGCPQKYRHFIHALSIFLFLTISSTCLADWQIVIEGQLPHDSFQTAVTKERGLYLCRDRYSSSFGIVKEGEGCQLIMGGTLITQDYEILVDPDKNFYWKTVIQGIIPIAAFDGGQEPILGEKYLCLKQINGFSYFGSVIKNRCHYRTTFQTHHSRKYEILAKYWVQTNIIPKNTPPSGKNAWGDLYICRVQYNNAYIPGTTGRGMRLCQFIDEYGTKKESKEYEVQLGLPHKWGKIESKTENTVQVGNPSQYHICRAKLATQIYIGKRRITPEEGHPDETGFCHISLEKGSLKIKNYQLQLWAKY